MRGGALRVAQVEMPVSTGGTRKLTVGGWESRAGCLSTSLVGWVPDRFVEVFDTLRFTDRGRGITMESQVSHGHASRRSSRKCPDWAS